jgi:hypothetical protein
MGRELVARGRETLLFIQGPLKSTHTHTPVGYFEKNNFPGI